jgi:hypothetical protein
MGMGIRQQKISLAIIIPDSASLQRYLQENDKVELLYSEEEVRLTALIRLGDKVALDKHDLMM